MTDVWHTTKEKPMLHRDIILCGDGWSMPIDIMPETVNNICWENVEKWCYVDDLIKENDHTRKVLDKAIWWLNEIVENHRFTPISTAEKALKELKEEND